MCFSRGVRAPCPPPPLDQCMQYFALKKVSCEKQLTILTPRGGTLIFSAYAGSDPASNVHPPPPQKKIRNFKHPKKIFEILATKKKSQFCTLTLKKTLNCIEMTLKLAQFCDDPKKISIKSSYPKKYLFF